MKIKKEKEDLIEKNKINQKNIEEQKFKIQKEKELEKKRLIEKKRFEIEKIRNFVNYNWNCDDEEIINHKISYIPEYHKNLNIINDINKFRRKKQNYSKNIISVNF